jgi:hypothetical protein
VRVCALWRRRGSKGGCGGVFGLRRTQGDWDSNIGSGFGGVAARSDRPERKGEKVESSELRTPDTKQTKEEKGPNETMVLLSLSSLLFTRRARGGASTYSYAYTELLSRTLMKQRRAN